MPSVVTCPQCKRQLKIGDDAAGKRIKCTGCGTIFATRGGAPSPTQGGNGPQADTSAVTQCACPSCGTTLKLAAPTPIGKRIKCPKCAAVFAVRGKEVPGMDDLPQEREREKATPRRRTVSEEDRDDRADGEDDEEMEERPPRRRRGGKNKPRKASLAGRVSALILGLIGGLFSGGLGTAWIMQANSPEVKAMRELTTAIAREVKSKEFDAELARLDRMVRSSYFLLLAAPLGIAGGVLALLGRVKLGGALMLAAVPIPLFLNVLTLMALYFLLIGGLVALLTPSWPPGNGPSTGIVALITAGGWFAVLVGWIVVILALPKPSPEVKAGGEITVPKPPMRQPEAFNPLPPQFAPPAGKEPPPPQVAPPQTPPPAETPKAGIGSKVLAGFQWKEFKDSNGRYTVLMPKQPKEELPNYFTVSALEFGDLQAGVYSYNFSVLYDRRENEERTYEDQIKDWREANTDSEFKPSKDQTIQVKGHTGWEIVYKKPKEKEFVRRWFVKLKQGVAMVSVNVPDTPEWIAAANKFFDSFTPVDK
jgi:uncharacterized protein YbaR (Trm112 family)